MTKRRYVDERRRELEQQPLLRVIESAMAVIKGQAELIADYEQQLDLESGVARHGEES